MANPVVLVIQEHPRFVPGEAGALGYAIMSVIGRPKSMSSRFRPGASNLRGSETRQMRCGRVGVGDVVTVLGRMEASSSVAPCTCPRLTPPPAIHIEKA